MSDNVMPPVPGVKPDYTKPGQQITAARVEYMVRAKMRDHTGTVYSEYDIRDAINEALRYINMSTAMSNSDFILKQVRIDQAEINNQIEEENKAIEEGEDKKPLVKLSKTGVELPPDYLSLDAVVRVCDGYNMIPCAAHQIPLPNQYKIMQNKIYAGYPCIDVTYRRAIPIIADMDVSTVIDMPFFTLDLIVKITCMILAKTENDILLQNIDILTRSLIPARRYSNARMSMPFKV